MDLTPPRGADEAGRVLWEELAKDPRFTEHREDLTKLYDIVRYGQLNHDEMSHLTVDQLTFLAAHYPAVETFRFDEERARARIEEIAIMMDATPRTAVNLIAGYVAETVFLQKRIEDLLTSQNKLENNARRATAELENRRSRSALKRTILATLCAAIIGAGAAVIGSRIADTDATVKTPPSSSVPSSTTTRAPSTPPTSTPAPPST